MLLVLLLLLLLHRRWLLLLLLLLLHVRGERRPSPCSPGRPCSRNRRRRGEGRGGRSSLLLLMLLLEVPRGGLQGGSRVSAASDTRGSRCRRAPLDVDPKGFCEGPKFVQVKERSCGRAPRGLLLLLLLLRRGRRLLAP